MQNFTNYITELYKPDKLDRLIDKVNKIPYSHDHIDSREFVKRYASKLGVREIGRGIYGNVFSIPGYPWVIKLWSVRDEGYPSWLEFIKSHAGNPYVPVVKGSPVKFGDDLMAVRLESLLPMTYPEWKIFNKHMRDVEYGDKKDPELLKLMKGFRMYDLHSENIMIRPGTLHPVITDPAS